MLLISLRRRVRLVCAILVAALALGVLFTALGPQLYVATAEVVVDVSEGAVVRGANGAAMPADDRLATEAAIVRSRAMAAGVAEALHLTPDAAFLDDAGIWARLRGALGLRGQEAIGGAAFTRRAVDALVSGVSAERPAQTYSLAIGFASPDPAEAARIANAFAQRYVAESAAGAALSGRPDARIISAAEPPLVPSSPRPLANIGVALLLGAIAAAAAAVIVEKRFAGLTGSAEIQRKLGLAHLGSVPTLRSVLPGATSPLDAIVDEPMSGFAEAFRSVMMAARHAGGKGTQVFAITSSLPNEGKSTIAACLARSVALGGESVVLVDCDSRRRDVSAMFRADGGRPGLAEVLRLEKTLDEALVRDEASGAWILPLTGPPAEISDLLGGAAMEALIVELSRRFRRVVIDTAPILPISATRAIVAMADIVLMVVRWRTTADHAVTTALRMLPTEHVRIGGVVLSQIDMRKQVKYGKGDQTFYYQQYSKYYS